MSVREKTLQLEKKVELKIEITESFRFRFGHFFCIFTCCSLWQNSNSEMQIGISIQMRIFAGVFPITFSTDILWIVQFLRIDLFHVWKRNRYSENNFRILTFLWFLHTKIVGRMHNAFREFPFWIFCKYVSSILKWSC